VAALGVALRLAGAHFFVEWVEAASFLVCLAGGCLCLGGGRLLRWASPAVGLLLFMVPLPYFLESALSVPLRRVSTAASAALLQVLGFPAVAEENVILIGEVRVGVVEACNGLGMIATLFALVVAAACFVRRPPWEKAVAVASTVPIALFANVVRITLTGVLYQAFGSEAGDAFFHDLAGWVMMPLALTLVWAEFQVLSRLFVEVPEQECGLGFGFPTPGLPADRVPAVR
jgi:exosortase